MVRALLALAVVVLSVIPIVRFIATALARIDYPFELEWIEGGSVSHIQMAMSGHSIYRAPSLDFTAFIYPPLYYYVCALPSRLLGVGLFAPRLVSFLSTLGSFALLARWVRDETGDVVAGFAAAGIFSSLYQFTGWWMDLARVDSFFLLLTLAANVMARSAQTKHRAAWVGVLLAAACFTKQVGIPLTLPPLLFLTMRSWRLGLVAALVGGCLTAVAALAFDISSAGWFHYYMLQLPSRHPIEWVRLWPDTQTFFLGTTLPLTLAGIALLCGAGFDRTQRKPWLYVALFVAFAVATSFLPFLKSGGYVNGLIPAYAALSLAAGIQVAALRQARNTPLGLIGPTVFAALLVAYESAQLSYRPSDALPSDADLATNQHALARMKTLPRPIWVTASSNWTRLTQPDGVTLHVAGLSDVFKGGGPEAAQLRADMIRALQEHRFATIVDDRAFGFLPGDIVGVMMQHYRRQGSVLNGVGNAAWPKTGAAIRPDGIWIAR